MEPPLKIQQKNLPGVIEAYRRAAKNAQAAGFDGVESRPVPPIKFPARVYVIGMAEDILPSYQSRQKGDKSAEMEEEHRNCFVAITRAKECLILSRADRYRGWKKPPSRFLVEMELAA